MTHQKLMLKKERGNTESAFEKKMAFFFARWKCNGVVTIGSTIHGVRPNDTLKNRK